MSPPIRLATALLLAFACAVPVSALSPGTPDAYMRDGYESFQAGYWNGAITAFRQATMLRPDDAEAHFMLAAALGRDGRWDEARGFFERAVALRPGLRGDADAWLAAAPGHDGDPNVRAPVTAPSPAPAPAPSPSPSPEPAPEPAPIDDSEPRMFAVGDRVEVMYREGFWIPGVVTASDYPGACPYYRVSADAYGNGNPSELGYGCKSIRAPTGVGEVVAECGGGNANCTPTAPPPTGAYHCTELVWQGPGANPQYLPAQRGTLTLRAGGHYTLLSGGDVGSYRYDATTHRITWSGGGLAGRDPVATFGLDGATPEITIEFPTDHTRRTGAAPPKWQCGLGR